MERERESRDRDREKEKEKEHNRNDFSWVNEKCNGESKGENEFS